MSEFRIPLPRVEDGDHDVLVVPMSDLPVTALNVAERLYRLGAVRRLSAA